MFLTVDGRYSQWSAWSQCSVTCGNGTQLRSRSCTNPPPADNGAPCKEHSEESRICTSENCTRLTGTIFLIRFLSLRKYNSVGCYSETLNTVHGEHDPYMGVSLKELLRKIVWVMIGRTSTSYHDSIGHAHYVTGALYRDIKEPGYVTREKKAKGTCSSIELLSICNS